MNFQDIIQYNIQYNLFIFHTYINFISFFFSFI